GVGVADVLAHLAVGVVLPLDGVIDFLADLRRGAAGLEDVLGADGLAGLADDAAAAHVHQPVGDYAERHVGADAAGGVAAAAVEAQHQLAYRTGLAPALLSLGEELLDDGDAPGHRAADAAALLDGDILHALAGRALLDGFEVHVL